jgi:hypothetical protein
VQIQSEDEIFSIYQVPIVDGENLNDEDIEYLNSIEEPICEGSDTNVLQLSYLIQEFAAKFHLGPTQTSMLLALFSKVLPEGNNIPTSFHMWQKVLDADTALNYELHTCENQCQIFLPSTLHPSKYYAYRDQKCSICQAPRFKKSTKAMSSRVFVPVKRYTFQHLRNNEFLFTRPLYRMSLMD